MVKPICRDTIVLSKRSVPATKDDLTVVDNLVDTLKANADRCVGMAANMIGVNKRILAFSVGPMVIPMINPIITKRVDPYTSEEGCLSLDGTRPTTRYQSIEVEFYDSDFKLHKQTFTGFIAQIIQHEMDHFEGILI